MARPDNCPRSSFALSPSSVWAMSLALTTASTTGRRRGRTRSTPLVPAVAVPQRREETAIRGCRHSYGASGPNAGRSCRHASSGTSRPPGPPVSSTEKARFLPPPRAQAPRPSPRRIDVNSSGFRERRPGAAHPLSRRSRVGNMTGPRIVPSPWSRSTAVPVAGRRTTRGQRCRQGDLAVARSRQTSRDTCGDGASGSRRRGVDDRPTAVIGTAARSSR